MKKYLVSIIAIILLFTAIPFSFNAAEEEKNITLPFHVPGMWNMEWRFPYSDSYFSDSSAEFSRDIAKASLGLTISAFRKDKSSTVPNQYEVYLGEAGFDDIYAFGYDKPTSPETLSGVMAHKQIDDFTLIAISPCGQGYEKEWGGNLNVGTGERHEGFNIGAKILEKEVTSYINEHALSGKLKLWISSFSRGAAVSNLAAADLIDAGIFDDVYAYLYAVPRTTKKSTAYPNIYNIVGAWDPVPQIPLESWGYDRNGCDLFLPSAETTEDFNLMMLQANEVTALVADDFLRFNPELNYQFHLILEFLGEMFTTNEEYVAKMQDEVMKIWTESNPNQMFQILINVFDSLEELDRRQEYARDTIIDYLEYLLSERLKDTRGSYEMRDLTWAKDQEMAANLMREHMPYIYLSWIFSTLSNDQLFGGSYTTQRLTVIGDVDVEVWKNDIFIGGLTKKGDWIDKYTDETTEDYFKSVFTVRNGHATILFLPAHTDFQVRITTYDNTGFSYRADSCHLTTTYGTSDGFHIVSASPGTYELSYKSYQEKLAPLKALDGNIIGDILTDREYSPTLAMKIQTATAEHVPVSFAISVAFGMIAFIILLLLVCLVIAIVHKIRKKKHGPYSPWFVIIPHYLLLILFVWLTIFFTETLYVVSPARIVLSAASSLVLFLLALRGLIRNRNIPNLIITVGFLILSILNVTVYQRSDFVGESLLINMIYCLLMAALAAIATTTFWRKKKTEPSDKSNIPSQDEKTIESL